MSLAETLGFGYVVPMPPAMAKRTEVGDRIWKAMKANGDSLAKVARAFKVKGLPIRSVGGLRYMMEQADRYDERVVSALCERYGHSRSFWFTGIEDVAPPERSMDRLGAYITGTFMEEIRQTVAAEARRLADQEWATVLAELDDETAHRVRAAREAVAVQAGVSVVPRPAGPIQPQPLSGPSQDRKAS